MGRHVPPPAPFPEGDLLNPGIEPGSSEFKAILYQLSHQGSPFLPLLLSCFSPVRLCATP